MMVTWIAECGDARGFFINDHVGYGRGTSASYPPEELTVVEGKLIPITPALAADAEYVMTHDGEIDLDVDCNKGVDHDFIAAAKRLANAVRGA